MEEEAEVEGFEKKKILWKKKKILENNALSHFAFAFFFRLSGAGRAPSFLFFLITGEPMALHARAWRAVIVLALAAWCSLAGVSSASVEQFSVDAFRISLSLSLSLEKIETSFYLSLSLSRSLSCCPSPFLFSRAMAPLASNAHNSSNAHIEIHCPSPEKNNKQQVSPPSTLNKSKLRRQRRRPPNNRTIPGRPSGRRSRAPSTRPLLPLPPRDPEQGRGLDPSSAAATWPMCGGSR